MLESCGSMCFNAVRVGNNKCESDFPYKNRFLTPQSHSIESSSMFRGVPLQAADYISP